MRKSLSLLAALALYGGAFGLAPAHAGEPAGAEQHLSVFYGDLDLTGNAGAAVFLERVKTAASQVCGVKPDNRDLAGQDGYRACLHEAVRGAVARLGNPTVSALYGEAMPQVAEGR